MSTPITGTASGVPFVAIPPATNAENSPVVISWHLMDPPNTPAGMAAALPLSDLGAWRIHLGLPLFGDRNPGPEKFYQLAGEDVVLNVFTPVVTGAFAEFPAAFAALRGQLGLGEGPIGLLGGSAGAFVPQLVLTESDLPVAATALVSPAVQLRRLVDVNERALGMTYPWPSAAIEAADRLDFVARADDIAKRSPATLLVVGALDDAGFREPAAELATAIGPTADLVTVPGMEHALADDPDGEPTPGAAPASESAVRVNAIVTDFFRRHLTSQ